MHKKMGNRDTKNAAKNSALSSGEANNSHSGGKSRWQITQILKTKRRTAQRRQGQTACPPRTRQETTLPRTRETVRILRTAWIKTATQASQITKRDQEGAASAAPIFYYESPGRQLWPGASDFHRKSRTAAMARSIKSRTFWHWYHIIKEKVTVRLKQGQLERSGFG